MGKVLTQKEIEHMIRVKNGKKVYSIQFERIREKLFGKSLDDLPHHDFVISGVDDDKEVLVCACGATEIVPHKFERAVVYSVEVMQCVNPGCGYIRDLEYKHNDEKTL